MRHISKASSSENCSSKDPDSSGCHAHAQAPLDFHTTAAAQADYVVPDLANTTPLMSKDLDNTPIFPVQNIGAVDVEYYRDIKPILQRSCVQCHTLTGQQEGQLVCDDESLVDGYENTYHRLANDTDAEYGIPPLRNKWWNGNMSRTVRAFQSRRSLLIWKIFGERRDGWTNADFPSALIPGDPTSLPEGGTSTEKKLADIDFSGTICPPPDSGIPGLSEDEKMTFARWIDLGAPIHKAGSDTAAFGWFTDEVRPTLTISSPRPGTTIDPLSFIRIGLHDFNTGLDMASFSVIVDFAINGQPAGTELAGLFAETGDHIWTYTLQNAISQLNAGEITVRITDNQGNTTSQKRYFSINPGSQPPNPQLQIAMLVQTPNASGADVQFTYTITGDQTEVTQVHFQLDDQPAVTDDDQNGQFVFANVTPGQHTITGFLSRTDSTVIVGSEDSVSFEVLQPPNNPPSIEPISDISAEAGSLVSFPIVATDPDADDTLTLSSTGLPANASVQQDGPRSWTLSWQTTPGDVGTFSLSFVVNDGTDDSAARTVTLTLESPPEPTHVAVRLTARDQSGQEVSGAQIYLRQTRTWYTAGTTLDLSVGEQYRARGRLGSLSGPLHAMTITASTQEIVVPFQTVNLLAQDQTGADAIGVLLQVKNIEGGPFAPGETVSLPQGAQARVRGQTQNVTGTWVAIPIDAGLAEIVVPFWTAAFVAVDSAGQPLNDVVFSVRNFTGSFLPAQQLTLPKGAKVKVRAMVAGQNKSWKSFVFTDGLNEIVPPGV